MDRIDVAVRCRPIIERDTISSEKNILSKNKDDISRSNPLVVDIDEDQGQVIVALKKPFAFDKCFDSGAEQASVFNKAVAPLVQKFVANCENASILAYGQTGSGKTYTMMGQLDGPQSKGMIPRAIEAVFNCIDSTTDVLCISFFEIYNEKVYDLLSDNQTPCTIREENQRFIVNGLCKQNVLDAITALSLLEKGNTKRSTAATGHNETSSRSHAILQLYLQRQTKNASLNLVDLAGSESVRKTDAAGERLTEGNNINKGLLALGNCISDICHKKVHIPYRDSYLTKVLRESLQDGGWTGMIICISPTEKDMNETLNTLRYADRAKELTKPAIPQHLLKEDQASQKRKIDVSNIPPTPAIWKRPFLASGGLKMNHTIETPTPSKRLAVLSKSRADTCQSVSFVTPSETPSEFNSRQKRNILAASVKRNMDRLLQDIEEDTSSALVDATNFNDRTLQPENSPTRLVDSFTPHIAIHQSTSALPRIDTTNINNATIIDASNLSPMIRKITEQVGKKFEQRLGAMEERFLNQLENTFSYRRSPRIMERTDTEQKTTMKRQKLRDHNKENSVFGELGNSPEEVVSGMAFRDIRDDMRKSQRIFHNVINERELDIQHSDIISKSNALKPNINKINHLKIVAPSASPHLAKTPIKYGLQNIHNETSSKFNLTPRRSSPKVMSSKNVASNEQSPTILEMANTLGIDSTSPSFEEIFDAQSQNKNCSMRPSERIRNKRKAMTPRELQRSISNSELVVNNERRAIRRSIRLSTQTPSTAITPNQRSEFKQPFAVKSTWKVRDQEKHNSRILELLNTANIKMLQSMPAIGPKTAYLLMQHRELHHGFQSLDELKDIPGIQKNFYMKFVTTHQIK